jgi:hypothetical protein
VKIRTYDLSDSLYCGAIPSMLCFSLNSDLLFGLSATESILLSLLDFALCSLLPKQYLEACLFMFVGLFGS